MQYLTGQQRKVVFLLSFHLDNLGFQYFYFILSAFNLSGDYVKSTYSYRLLSKVSKLMKPFITLKIFDYRISNFSISYFSFQIESKKISRLCPFLVVGLHAFIYKCTCEIQIFLIFLRLFQTLAVICERQLEVIFIQI